MFTIVADLNLEWLSPNVELTLPLYETDDNPNFELLTLIPFRLYETNPNPYLETTLTLIPYMGDFWNWASVIFGQKTDHIVVI